MTVSDKLGDTESLNFLHFKTHIKHKNLHNVSVPDVQRLSPSIIKILHHKLQCKDEFTEEFVRLNSLKVHSVISHLKNVIFNVADFNARVFPTRSVCQ